MFGRTRGWVRGREKGSHLLGGIQIVLSVHEPPSSLHLMCRVYLRPNFVNDARVTTPYCRSLYRDEIDILPVRWVQGLCLGLMSTHSGASSGMGALALTLTYPKPTILLVFTLKGGGNS